MHWQSIWPVLLALFFFGLIIMTHELGHFLFAKLFKVKVNEFSVGMGPTLFKKQKGETKYSVRLLPIGGYVAMEGEDEDSDVEGSLNSKPAWQRGIILLAGAFINILTGMIIMAVLLSTTDLIGLPEIAGFTENSVSSSYGLEQGDRILVVNNHKIHTEYDLSYFVMTDKDGVSDLIVLRDGEEKMIRRVNFKMLEADGMKVAVPDFIVKGVKPSPGIVTKYAFLDSISVARVVWDSMGKLIKGEVSAKQLSGPIGAVGVVADSTKAAATSKSYRGLLSMLAFIALNVGFFNLLPFPALDGGRFVFVILEGIFRRPVSERFQQSLNAAGMLFLLGLMIYVTVNDVIKLL